MGRRTQPSENTRRARPRLLRFLAAVGLAFLAFLILDYFAYPYGDAVPHPSGNRGENGLWLHYTWYFGEKPKAELDSLPQHLANHQIRYAYFHVRFIGKSGKLRFRYPERARALNAHLHRKAPGVVSLAWIYVGNTRGGGDVALSDARVRKQAVAEARFLATECGFDGVQWDYEICPDGDKSLLLLLEETRAALPPGKQIGVATALWAPQPLQALGHGWSEGYFGDVARRSDQIAVMGYDSGLYLPRAFVWLIAQQVVRVTRSTAEANPACRVLIGVPTYEEGGPSHHAPAENLSMALRGVAQGVAALSPREHPVFAGIAPFADYTTDSREWEAYRMQYLAR